MRLKLVAFLWNALIIIVTVIFIHLLEVGFDLLDKFFDLTKPITIYANNCIF